MPGVHANHQHHNYSAWAEINLDALRHNLNVVRGLAPHSRVMTMIKANAYGHGLIECARAIGPEASALAVARLDEALALRDANINRDLVLMSTHWTPLLLEAACEHDIQLVIGSREQVAMLQEQPLRRPLSIWLKQDSGMHRMGLNKTDFSAAIQALSKHPQVKQLRLMTHLATADEAGDTMSADQIRQFDDGAQAAPEDLEASIANSAAIIRYPEAHRDWVRPGIMLYGCDPRDSSLLTDHPIDLKPVMSLYSRVLRVDDIASGESVGYGATWRATKPSRIATLGIGYGDGYPRQLASGTPVQFGGGIAPLAGRVSMDLISVDVTELDTTPEVGDIACLWGQAIRAEAIAARASTIAYHLLTGITARVPRIYSAI